MLTDEYLDTQVNTFVIKTLKKKKVNLVGKKKLKKLRIFLPKD